MTWQHNTQFVILKKHSYCGRHVCCNDQATYLLGYKIPSEPQTISKLCWHMMTSACWQKTFVRIWWDDAVVVCGTGAPVAVVWKSISSDALKNTCILYFKIKYMYVSPVLSRVMGIKIIGSNWLNSWKHNKLLKRFRNTHTL